MTKSRVVYLTMKTKPRFSFWTFCLLTVFLASGCAPAASTQAPAAQIPTQTSIPPATETATLPSYTSAPDTPTPPATSTPTTPTVQFIPTSRGPDLEATDPTTVSLASGGLQLVEFFRFT
ncbi:MAG: hypothetical protein AB1649_26080 [Chloroflexota bacterium]